MAGPRDPHPCGVVRGGIRLLFIYTTELFHLVHASALTSALVHTHIFLAAYVFMYSLIGTDPNPHRASFGLRSGVLIAFIAVHQILAKRLYASSPEGVAVTEAEVGAQVMFSGDDAVDVDLIVLLFLRWYSSARPRSSPHEKSFLGNWGRTTAAGVPMPRGVFLSPAFDVPEVGHIGGEEHRIHAFALLGLVMLEQTYRSASHLGDHHQVE